jgi:hypothetical protein
MPSRLDVFQRILSDLYPTRDGKTVPSAEVNPHLAALIFILAVDEVTFAATLPDGNTVTPEEFFKAYPNIDRSVITDDHVSTMLAFRDGFARVQQAWFEISNYEPPPCPPSGKLRSLVEFTKKFSC